MPAALVGETVPYLQNGMNLHRIRTRLSAAVIPAHAAVGLILTVWLIVGALALIWLVGTGRGEDPHGYVLVFVGAPTLGLLMLIGVPLAGLVLGVYGWRSGRGSWLLVLADLLIVVLATAFLSLESDAGPWLTGLAAFTLGFALAACVIAALAQRPLRQIGWRNPSD